MSNLDIKDKKILYFLSKDARLSHVQLGKLAGVSKNAASYRIQKLIDEGIIKNFSAVINPVAIGCSSFSIFFKFNKSIYQNKDIIDYFKNYPYSIWVTTLSGTFDLYVEFLTRDFEHINKIISDFKSQFEETLNHYELILLESTLRVEHLISDIYKDLKLTPFDLPKRNFKSVTLDLLDKKILKTISLESNLSFIEIAKKVNSTWDVVRYRLKNLEEAGLIIKYFPEIDLSKLGYTTFLCNLKLHNISTKNSKAISSIFRTNENITYAFYALNFSGIVFECSYKNISDLDLFLSSLNETFKENIVSVDYYLVKEEIKFDLFPHGLVSE